MIKWILIAALAAMLVGWLASRGAKGKKRPSLSKLRRRLAKLTHDPAVADRLVEGERKRHPELDEAQILRRVIRRLERDRHR